MDYVSDYFMGSSLESSIFVEGSQKQSQEMVCSFAYTEHSSHFRDHIYFHFQQKKAGRYKL